MCALHYTTTAIDHSIERIVVPCRLRVFYTTKAGGGGRGWREDPFEPLTKVPKQNGVDGRMSGARSSLTFYGMYSSRCFFPGSFRTIKDISIREMLPNIRYYMTYEGSTTHPGCWETAVWIVLNKPIYITKREVSTARALAVGNGTVTGRRLIAAAAFVSRRFLRLPFSQYWIVFPPLRPGPLTFFFRLP